MQRDDVPFISIIENHHSETAHQYSGLMEPSARPINRDLPSSSPVTKIHSRLKENDTAKSSLTLFADKRKYFKYIEGIRNNVGPEKPKKN